MVASAKAAVPTVTDQAAAMQLGQCAKNLATSLAELRTAAQKVRYLDGGIVIKMPLPLLLLVEPCYVLQAHEACGPMEIDSALNAVQTLKNELQDAKMAATDRQLKPLPGETVILICPAILNMKIK